MHGLMMDMSLLISDLLRHAARHHGSGEVVSKTVEQGSVHRYTYRDAHERARKLANALKRLGVAMHDRVATLAWNSSRHFEIYYAAAGSGAVIHTINPRLFADQIVYIANHAEDRVVFFDVTFAPLIEKLAPQLKSVKHFVAMAGRAHMDQMRPQMAIWPRVGSVIRLRSLSSVLLPAPFRPMIPNTSPSCTSKVTSRNAWISSARG